MLLAGLIAYGAGMGVIYYASLYYVMTVGDAAVDAGGNFEALIGVGLLPGPAAGDRRTGRSARRIGSASLGRSATVGLTWLVAALAGRGALRPYLAARRRR